MRKSLIGVWQRYLKHMPMFGESFTYLEKKKLLDAVVFYQEEKVLPEWLAKIEAFFERILDKIDEIIDLVRHRTG